MERENKYVRWIALWAVLLVLAGALVLPGKVYAKEKDSTTSFYDITSAASAFYDATQDPDSDYKDCKDKIANVEWGNAGAMLGYLDTDRDTLLGYALSKISLTADDRDYIQLYNTKKDSGLYQYAAYGYALQSLGLDSSVPAAGGAGVIGRGIMGGLTLMSFAVAALAELGMNVIIHILQAFNPFGWFLGADATGQMGGLARYLTENRVGYWAPLASIVSIVSGAYKALSQLSLYIMVPVFFALLALSLTLLRNVRTQPMQDGPWGKIKRYLLRVGFIILGIPLLGMMYTIVLNNMVMDDVGAQNASSIVLSNYVDFEAWAKDGLSLPKDDTIKVVYDEDTRQFNIAPTSTQTRRLAQDINKTTNGVSFTNQMATANDYSLNYDKASSWSNSNTTKVAWDMLIRYMTSSTVSSSDFEGNYKSALGDSSASTAEKSVMKEMSSIESYKTKPYFTADLCKAAYIRKSGTNATVGNDKSVTFRGQYTGSTNPSLSELSMYNYLNTTFSKTGLTTYSSGKSASKFVRDAHLSVSAIGGGGIMSILYQLNTMTMLSCVAILAIFYSFGLLFANLKRGLRMIGSLPMAMLGSLGSIARCISIVLMMIVEVIATIFTYGLVAQLLVVFGSGFQDLIYEIFTQNAPIISMQYSTITMGTVPSVAVSTLSKIFPPTAIYIATLILGTVCCIWFTIMAMRLRKVIVCGIDEQVTKWIDNFFMTSGSGVPNARPSALRAGAGALATGAGMAAGRSFINRGLNGSDADAAVQGDGGVSSNTISMDGGAVNPGGDPDSPLPAGGGGGGSLIAGADRQSAESDGTATPMLADNGEEANGRMLLAANAESLSDLPSGNAEAGNAEAGNAEAGNAEAGTKDVHADGKENAKTVAGAAGQADVDAQTALEQANGITAESIAESAKNVAVDAKAGQNKYHNDGASSVAKAPAPRRVVRAQKPMSSQEKAQIAQNREKQQKKVAKRQMAVGVAEAAIGSMTGNPMLQRDALHNMRAGAQTHTNAKKSGQAYANKQAANRASGATYTAQRIKPAMQKGAPSAMRKGAATVIRAKQDPVMFAKDRAMQGAVRSANAVRQSAGNRSRQNGRVYQNPDGMVRHMNQPAKKKSLRNVDTM